MIYRKQFDYKFRSQGLLKPLRFFVFKLCFVLSFYGNTQNTLTKELEADGIETISIDGNQIFNISIETKTIDFIKVSSTLDGEYQNEYQVATNLIGNELNISLRFMSFEDIPDDKRNAHKVIAATLLIVIPEHLDININSDVGSVEAKGNFNNINVELLEGYCTIDGIAKSALINTIDGNINVVTTNAEIKAKSNNGSVLLENFNESDFIWNLRSINGTIKVVKKE